MTTTTWQGIEQKGMDYIDRCVANREPLFLCSDDASYKDKFLMRIRSKGGDIVAASPPPPYRHLPGYEALVDFFALSRSSRIIQMTKYSTYSLAAAMVGGIPLINFYAEKSDAGHRLDIWRSALYDFKPIGSNPHI
jgi:hypothetical protein